MLILLLSSATSFSIRFNKSFIKKINEKRFNHNLKNKLEKYI